MTQLLSMQVGRHELQPGEGVDCRKEGAGGSLGGEGAAWGGCFFLFFLAVHNSSIGDLVTHSLTN